VPSRTAARKPESSVRFVLDPRLESYAYRCFPDGCPRDRTCCVGLAVEVSKREVRAIDSLMDELARIVPALRDDDGYASVFVAEEPPDLLIESDDDGACPFLYRTKKNALCSIHSLALETGRHVPDVKPAACRHWPVMLERDGDDVRVTLQPHAVTIGCVAPRAELPGKPSVLEAYREEIAEMCGGEVPVRAAADRAARARVERRGAKGRGAAR
jgi:Fe-S-cluster containining protein